MFIFTAKVPRRKLALGVTLAALACCCLFALDLGHSPAQAAAASAPGVKGVRTNRDRVDFLRSFGWEVAEEPLATQEMVIPQEFDDSYAQYIDLQRQQGFDLERYAGIPMRSSTPPPGRRGSRPTCCCIRPPSSAARSSPPD